VQNHVLTQVLRLRSYPCVERRLAEGGLRLHAWFYEVHTGVVRQHRAHTGTFETL
jgi:carbonic anhydrase